MAPSCYKSYSNDFDKEWLRKHPQTVIGHISMILIGSCKGNGPELLQGIFSVDPVPGTAVAGYSSEAWPAAALPAAALLAAGMCM